MSRPSLTPSDKKLGCANWMLVIREFNEFREFREFREFNEFSLFLLVFLNSLIVLIILKNDYCYFEKFHIILVKVLNINWL